jgi:exosortase A-associated hydrolase 1
MNYTESAVQFGCAGESLLGIIAAPAKGQTAPIGVVIVVGGPQYRAGSHRLFTLLARSLAAAGYTALRFDYRGMGDSEGQPRDFESISQDIGAAVDALMAQSSKLKEVVLWGLCDGASAALLDVRSRPDPRLTGLFLINPWVRSPAGLAKAHVKHYYGRRLMQVGFWSKLLRGKIGSYALIGLARNASMAWRSRPPAADQKQSFQELMAQGLLGFPGTVTLILSGRDLVAKEFIEQSSTDAQWRRAMQMPNLQRIDLAEADHIFSQTQDRNALLALTLRQMKQRAMAEVL